VVGNEYEADSLIGELVALRRLAIVARATRKIQPGADHDALPGKTTKTASGKANQRNGAQQTTGGLTDRGPNRYDPGSHECGLLNAWPLERHRLDHDVVPIKGCVWYVIRPRQRQGTGHDAQCHDAEHGGEQLLHARMRYAGNGDDDRRHDSYAFGARDTVDEDNATCKTAECKREAMVVHAIECSVHCMRFTRMSSRVNLAFSPQGEERRDRSGKEQVQSSGLLWEGG